MFERIIKSKMALYGISVDDLARRTGIQKRTLYRRLTDGEWTRNDLISLHKVLGLTAGDIGALLGKELK